MNAAGEPQREIRFIDTGGALDPVVREQLARVVTRFPVSVEVLVQVVARVPGRRFRPFATQARREHSRSPDRSLILVVALDDRHVELATAPAWARPFDPARSAALLAAHFVPAMKAGDLPAALTATLAAVGGCLRNPPPAVPRRGRGLKVAGVGLAVLLVLGGVGYACLRDHFCRECRSWGDVTTTVLAEATYVSVGQREVHFHCPKCGADYRDVRIVPVRSTSSSTDASGGSDSGGGSDGGGSDGGGGADW